MKFGNYLSAGIVCCTFGGCDISQEAFQASQARALSDGYQKICAGVFRKDFSINGIDNGKPIEKPGSLFRYITPNLFDSGVELSGTLTVTSYQISNNSVYVTTPDGTFYELLCFNDVQK